MQHQNARRAMVTGASSGIGKAFAQQLALQGYQITLVSRRGDQLQTVADNLPGEHEVLIADLERPADLALVESALRARRFDLLVNNAGGGHYGSYHNAPWQKLASMLLVNCAALASLAHTYLHTAKRGDALINVSSILAFLPQPTSAMYCATKAFVTTLSEALWFENRERGVYVVGLHPGMTRTEFRTTAGGTATYPKSAHSPDDVARLGLVAVEERSDPTVVCGKLNALISGLPRMLTRRQVVEYLGRYRSYEPETKRSDT